MAYNVQKMNALHTALIVSVILIGTMSSIVYTADILQESTSPETTRIIQFRDANFSTWNEKVKYNSTALNSPKGMEPLYNLTTIILNFFLGEKPIPDGK